MVTPLLQSRYDCKDISIVFLVVNSLTMVAMGLSFTYPALSLLTIPCLVVSGLSYGLGVGPAPPNLMSTLFTQNMKSTGITIGQVVRALVNTTQLKVGAFEIEIKLDNLICTFSFSPWPARIWGWEQFSSSFQELIFWQRSSTRS